MTALHTIHRLEALDAALARLHPEDAVLLLEDAVYAAMVGRAEFVPLAERALYVLTSDLAARGIAESALAASLTPISMEDFVGLTLRHNPIVAWM